MNALKALMPLALLLQTILSYGQAYETGAAVHIPSDAVVIKTIKVKDCKEEFKAGSVVKTEFTRSNGDRTHTVSETKTLTKNEDFDVEKTFKIEMTGMEGLASLTADEKDKSVLLINYFLSPVQRIPLGKYIRILDRKTNCDGSTVIANDQLIKLVKDTTFAFYRHNMEEAKIYCDKVGAASGEAFKKKSIQVAIDATSNAATKASQEAKEASQRAKVACESITDQLWFKHSPKAIVVYKDSIVDKPSKVIDYYLVNTVDENATYSIKLDNREFISYNRTSVEFGALTIPFRRRYGYSKPSENGRVPIEVKSDYTADFNVGVFGGFRYGKRRVRFEAPAQKELANLGVTIGPFFNLSTAALDQATTTAGKNPFGKDDKATIGVWSIGLGAMLDFYNLRLGVFWGRDNGFGSDAKNWNYNGRSWLGLGVGYSLTSGFWKK